MKDAIPTFPLFALVGPGGAGKTELSVRLLNLWPLRDRPLSYVRTLTDRAPRSRKQEELIPYEFVDRRRILSLRGRNRLAECAPHAGHFYAVTHAEIRRALADGPAVMALTEDGCRTFAQAGYHVVPIRIVPVNRPKRLTPTDPARLADDAERAKHPPDFYAEIENDFAADGLARALAALNDLCVAYVSLP